MKKLIYSLAMILVGMSSCATFDEPTTENYGAGPDVALSVTAGTPTDNAFNVQVTPGEGTTYYTMAISTSPVRIDSAVFIKGGYGNTVVKVADLPAINQPITDASPNTTYYVYAVACNDKGVVGKLASASIKTTDAGAPQKTKTQVDAASKTAAVAFDQLILRGEGKVTAKYYKEFDFNPVEIETVDVAISNNVAQMKVDAPEGAYVTFSWEEGAFVDEVGNRCAAYTSTLNMEGEDIDAIFANALWLRVPTTTWAITDDQFTAPEVGGYFSNWKDFEGVIEFKDKVYVLTDDVKDGDFTVTYANDSRTVTYKVPTKNINFGVAEDFSTKKVTFTLPAATTPGDKVTIAFAENIFKDVMGNGNAAYSSSKVYWINFAATKDDILGTFNFTWYNYFNDGAATDGGTITITEDSETENGIIISDMFVKGKQLKGYYNLDESMVYIKQQSMGVVSGYFGSFENASANQDIALKVGPGTMESEDYFGVYAYATEDHSDDGLGWLRLSVGATLTKVKASAARRKAASKSSQVWTPKKASIKK